MVVYQLFYFFFFPLLEAVMFRLWVLKKAIKIDCLFFDVLIDYWTNIKTIVTIEKSHDDFSVGKPKAASILGRILT